MFLNFFLVRRSKLLFLLRSTITPTVHRGVGAKQLRNWGASVCQLCMGARARTNYARKHQHEG